MYEAYNYNFQEVPMDTDGRASAWFDMPGPRTGWQKNLSDFGISPSATTFGNTFKPKVPLMCSNSNLPFLINDIRSTNANEPKNANQSYLNCFIKERISETISGSSKTKFTSKWDRDVIVINGVSTPIEVRFQNLACMNEYQNLSIEEIRLEDYALASISENMTRIENEQTMNPLLLNTLLQNITSGCHQKYDASNITSNEQVATAFNGKTFTLLQTLLNNVKQRFDVNCISEEAKQNCEKLTHALVEYTEKTLENLTVIVLEDMLNNIKRQKVPNPTKVTEKSTCSCSEKNSPPQKSDGENEHTEKHKTKKALPKKYNKKTTKQENDFSSDCRNSQAEETEFVYDEREHRCELTNKTKSSRRKAASLPASCSKTLSCRMRSARHSISGSGRSPDKSTRCKSRHRKSYDEKYNYWENAYDDTDNEECANRNNESKHSNRDEYIKRAVTFKAKHNSESFRRKKKSPKKVDEFVLDECICDHLRAVSVNDENRRDCVTSKEKSTPRYKERVFETVKGHTDEIINDDRQRADKNIGTSLNADESSLIQNEAEVESYSDSSSI